MQAITHHEIGFWKGAACYCAAKTSSLAVLALRVAASVVSVFSACGRNLARKIRREADRVYIIYVAHNLARISSSPLPLLVPARNMARRNVVRRKDDVAAANALRNRLLSTGSFKKKNPNLEEHLQKAYFKGANKGGVCLGASFIFIKSVLNGRCGSERELIKVSRAFAEGFPKEAAGLQMIHNKFNWPSEMSKSAHQGVRDLVAQEKSDESRMPALQKVGLVATQLGKLSKLVGIKVLKQPLRDFLQFDSDLAARRRFNALPEGSYFLRISIKQGGHAISYHKFSFGSYLFDPNGGLMKCQSSEPANDLAKLLQRYPGRANPAQEGSHHLMVFPCELAKAN